MNNLFDVLQMVRFNHLSFDSSQVVITDVEGKPNAILTDLFRDVVSKVNLFIDLSEAFDAGDVVASLKAHTPLPADVLDEYTARFCVNHWLALTLHRRRGRWSCW